PLGGGGAGGYALGGGAPARLVRARDSARSSNPHSGRGDEQRGYGNGARDPAGAGTVGGGPDRVRHCPPAVDAAQGVAAVRDRGGPVGGTRDACRAARETRRDVSASLRAARA